MASRIRIDTSIDDSGFVQGLQKMSGAMNRFVNGVAGGMSKADKAWGAKQHLKIEATGKKIDKVTESIRRQEVMVEQLAAKLGALNATDNVPGSMKAMQREIDNTEKKLTPMLERFNQMSDLQEMNLSARGKVDPALDMQMEELGAKIRAAEAHVDSLKTKLAELRANPQASREGEALAQKLALAQQRLDDLRLTSNELGASLRRLETAKPPSATGWGKIKDAITRTNREAGKTGGVIQGLGKQMDWFGRRMRSVVWMGLVFYHVRRAMIALTKYMFGALMANKQFAQSLGQIKGNLLTAFQPIYQAILPALNALMSALVRVTAAIASFMSMLFGSSIKASQQSAAALNAQAKAYGAAGGAAKKAAGELASFDQIEVLNRPDDGGGGGGGGGGVAPIFDDPEPSALMGAMQELYDWLQRVWEIALPTREAFARLWETLKMLGGFAWQNLVGFYENFLKPVGTWTLSEGIPRLVNSLVDMLNKVNWQSLTDHFNNLYAALAPFAVTVGEGLLWFWENVIMPISGWVLDDALPAFLNLFAAAAESANAILVAMAPHFEKFYNDVLVPVGNWVGQAFIDALNWIAQALRDVGQFFTDHPELADYVTKIAIAIGVITAAIVAFNVVTAAMNALLAMNPLGLIVLAIAAVIAAIWWMIENWDQVMVVVDNVVAWITDAWNNFMVWLDEAVIKPLVAWFTQAWKDISDWATNAWATIVRVWNVVAGWFNTNIIQPLSTFFSNLWSKIPEWASAAWTFIKGIWAVAFGWFRDNVLEPILNIFGLSWSDIENFASGAWTKIKGVWDTVYSWFSKNVITPLRNFFSSAWTAIQGFFNDPIGTIQELWGVVSEWFNTNVAAPVSKFFEDAWTAIQGFFNDPIGTIQELWGVVSTWFSENVIDPISLAFQTAWEAIQGFVNDPWGTIKEMWAVASEWFNTTVIQPIKDFFEPAWTSISGWVTGAWDTIKGVWTTVSEWFQINVITPVEDAFKAVATVIANVINGAIGIANWAINGIETGLNAVVDAINSVRIKIPGPTVMGKKLWKDIDFGPNVGHVSFGRIAEWQIPGLATGAVIPPNSKFLAMLGDQRSGNNIEAPESLIRQIVREETAGGGAGNFTLSFEGDLAGLARILRPVLKREGERIGTTIITGGEYAT